MFEKCGSWHNLSIVSPTSLFSKISLIPFTIYSHSNSWFKPSICQPFEKWLRNVTLGTIFPLWSLNSYKSKLVPILVLVVPFTISSHLSSWFEPSVCQPVLCLKLWVFTQSFHCVSIHCPYILQSHNFLL